MARGPAMIYAALLAAFTLGYGVAAWRARRRDRALVHLIASQHRERMGVLERISRMTPPAPRRLR